MIFSSILSIALSLLMLYAMLQKKQFPLIAKSLPLVCCAGIYVAWFPERTSELAEMVGVGRGVDLMLYVWMLVSGLLFLVVHLKLVTQERKLTELARALALAGTPAPEASSVRAAQRLSEG